VRKVPGLSAWRRRLSDGARPGVDLCGRTGCSARLGSLPGREGLLSPGRMNACRIRVSRRQRVPRRGVGQCEWAKVGPAPSAPSDIGSAAATRSQRHHDVAASSRRHSVITQPAAANQHSGPPQQARQPPAVAPTPTPAPAVRHRSPTRDGRRDGQCSTPARGSRQLRAASRPSAITYSGAALRPSAATSGQLHLSKFRQWLWESRDALPPPRSPM